MFRLFGIAVDAFDDDAFRALIPKEKPFVQLARNVVDALVVTQYPLRDCLTNLPDETFHIEILEDAPDDGICE